MGPGVARRAADALEQLARLAPRAVLGLADSAFNEADLARRRLPRGRRWSRSWSTSTGSAAPPDPRVAARLAAAKAAGGADWLFVGRLVPSKAQHDLVKALWAYRRLYDPLARLHLVGPDPVGVATWPRSGRSSPSSGCRRRCGSPAR